MRKARWRKLLSICLPPLTYGRSSSSFAQACERRSRPTSGDWCSTAPTLGERRSKVRTSDLIVLFKDAETAAASDSTVGDLAYRILVESDALVSPIPMSELKYQMGRSPFFLNVKREGIFVLSEEAAELSTEIERLMDVADESLEAAGELLGNEHFGFAASRACYAMFYAASAALLTKGLTFSRHSGVVPAFGHHFARADMLPQELHTTFREALTLRHLGDYGTEPFAESTAAGQLENERRFVDAVRGYLAEAV